MIQPEHLAQRDSTEIALPYRADGAVVPIQKFRDVRKLYAAMTDGKAEYVLYGVETQSEINYAMAVKNCLYGALDYAGQVEEAARSHRRAMEEARRQKQEGSAVSGAEPNGSIVAEAEQNGSIASKAEQNGSVASKVEQNGSTVSEAEQNGSVVSKAEQEGSAVSKAEPGAACFRRKSPIRANFWAASGKKTG